MKPPVVSQTGGEVPIIIGKDVAGPVTLKFQLSSPVRYVATSTRRITGSEEGLIASLKDYGFKQEGAEWVRSRRWGVTVTPLTSGFEPVPGPVAAHAVLKFHREFFATGESNDWGSLFLENGAKVVQEGNSEQVHVGDSYWMLNGLYGSTPEYEPRYYTTNKAGNSSLPEEPFKMPGKVAMGDSIPVSVNDANGTLPAIWRVSEIKEQGDTVYVGGRLKAVPGSAVKIDGTMVLRNDLGIVDRLRVRFSYPDGKWQGIGHGPWTYEIDYHLTDGAGFSQVRETQFHAFDSLSSTSTEWDKGVALVRLAGEWKYPGDEGSLSIKDGRFKASIHPTDAPNGSVAAVNGSVTLQGRHMILTPDGLSSGDFEIIDALNSGASFRARDVASFDLSTRSLVPLKTEGGYKERDTPAGLAVSEAAWKEILRDQFAGAYVSPEQTSEGFSRFNSVLLLSPTGTATFITDADIKSGISGNWAVKGNSLSATFGNGKGFSFHAQRGGFDHLETTTNPPGRWSKLGLEETHKLTNLQSNPSDTDAKDGKATPNNFLSWMGGKYTQNPRLSGAFLGKADVMDQAIFWQAVSANFRMSIYTEGGNDAFRAEYYGEHLAGLLMEAASHPSGRLIASEDGFEQNARYLVANCFTVQQAEVCYHQYGKTRHDFDNLYAIVLAQIDRSQFDKYERVARSLRDSVLQTKGDQKAVYAACLRYLESVDGLGFSKLDFDVARKKLGIK